MKDVPAAQQQALLVQQEALSATSEVWQTNAHNMVRWAVSQLTDDIFGYLNTCGLNSRTIQARELGYYPHYKKVDATKWGAAYGSISLPRGIVIPWFAGQNTIVCIRFWRLPGDESDQARLFYGVNERGTINHYKTLYGSSSQHLYRSGRITPGCTAILLAEEIDALILTQDMGGEICVATGSAGWGRVEANIHRLAACRRVLVCYSAIGGAGDKEAQFWANALQNARRWRPLWGSVSEMHNNGADLAAWVALGLEDAVSEEHMEAQLLEKSGITAEQPLCYECLNEGREVVAQYRDSGEIMHRKKHYHRNDRTY